MNLTEYSPRDVFLPLHSRKQRWAVVVAHRRAGKTVSVCADISIGAYSCALPNPKFAYLAPLRDQAKKVAWQYLKDLTQPWWVKKPNEAELKIEVRNAHGGVSTIYVGGADNPDSLRGLYFDGVAMDEFGDMRPSTWYSVIRPALSDRGGWAIFMGTPKGRNAFWNIREEARMNPDRYLLLTLPASVTGILPEDELRDSRAQMTPEAYEIEFECSFDASIPGAYFAREIGRIYDQGQIGENKRDELFPVYVVGDLGFTDSCSWWVWQRAYGGFRIVDYYEADGREIAHYIDWIKGLGHVAKVYLPHDAKAKSLQTGRSIIEVFLANGIHPEIIPKMDLQDGIEAARQILPYCWFDEDRCYEGLEHLRAYSRTWDEKTQSFKDRPNHDAHSHASDAFRYLALASGDIPTGEVLTHRHHDGNNAATYKFSLNDLWDTAPKPSRRIG